MRRALLALLATFLITGSTGCHWLDRAAPSGDCAGSCGPAPRGSNFMAQLHGRRNQAAAQAGQPTAAVTYPYYTTRGPRDFLVDNPPSIGR